MIRLGSGRNFILLVFPDCRLKLGEATPVLLRKQPANAVSTSTSRTEAGTVPPKSNPDDGDSMEETDFGGGASLGGPEEDVAGIDPDVGDAADDDDDDDDSSWGEIIGKCMPLAV